jgi:pimeloyl-[acyl-carrier protein] methyl ester esterase
MLIVINGWGFGESIWENFFEELYRMIGTKIEKEIVIWNDMNGLDDIEQKIQSIIRVNRHRRIVLIGWSLGSIVALKYLSEVEGAVLISPGVRFSRKENECIGWDEKSIERMKENLIADKMNVLYAFVNKLLARDEKLFYEKLVQVLECDCNKFSIQDLIYGLDCLKNIDFEEYVYKLDSNVLLIHGEKDRIVPLRRCLDMSDTNDEIKKIIVKRAGHIPFYTNREVVTNLVISHIRSLFDDR